MVELPSAARATPAPSIEGTMFLVIGEPKAGKTHLVMDWPECLVIDTQGGARQYGGLTVDLRALAQEEGRSELEILREVLKQLKDTGCKGYGAVAIDTLDDVSVWLEAEAAARCCKKHNRKPGYYTTVEDVPHGAGWGEHRRMVMGMVGMIHRFPVTTILVAHSRRLIDEESGEASKMVDLPGRLGHMVPGEVDHIAVATRSKEGEYLLDFSGYETRTNKGFLVRHSGSRLSALNGKVVASSYGAIESEVKRGVED